MEINLKANHTKKDPTQMKYDDALTQVGGQNKYQYTLSLLLGSQWILMCMVIMNATFWLQAPSFTCKDGSICTQEDAMNENRCNYENLVKDGDRTTITVDLGMYCEDSSYLTWSQSIVFIGSAIGSFFIPQISDRLGRKWPIFILQLLTGIFILGISLVTNKIAFMFLYFMAGFTIWPCEIIIYALLCETVNGKLRDRALVGCYLFWSIGEIIIAWIAYSISDWRDAMLYTITIPYLLFAIPNYLYVLESPLILLNKGSNYCAEMLNKIALINGKPNDVIKPEQTIVLNDQQNGISLQAVQNSEQDKNVEEDDQTQNQSQNVSSQKEQEQKQEKAQQKQYFVFDLFRYSSLRMIVINCSLVVGGLNILYFGSSLSFGTSSSDVYISVIVVGICETISNGLCVYFIHLLPRKKSMIIFYGIVIIICMGFIFFEYSPDQDDVPKTQQTLQIVLSGIMRVFNVFCNAVYGLYSQEIFPTPVRSMATGLTFAIGTLITFLAPFIIEFAANNSVSPIFALGVSGIFFFIPTFFFKETLGKPIKEFVEEDKPKYLK